MSDCLKKDAGHSSAAGADAHASAGAPSRAATTRHASGKERRRNARSNSVLLLLLREFRLIDGLVGIRPMTAR